MATSSITENFCCSDPKAANTVVRLLFSAKVPKSWCAPAPSFKGVTELLFKDERERQAHVRRMKRIMQRRMQKKGASSDV